GRPAGGARAAVHRAGPAAAPEAVPDRRRPLSPRVPLGGEHLVPPPRAAAGAPGVLLLLRGDAQRDPRRDGRDGPLPVRTAVRGGGVRHAGRQRRLGGAGRVLRARPRDPGGRDGGRGRRRPERGPRGAPGGGRRRPGPRARRPHRRPPRAAAAGAPRARARRDVVTVWGIVPAAGLGTRIQPLAFSKELLPVGSRQDAGVERPRAISEYLLDRLLLGGVTRVCVVIAPTKTDILTYYGGYYAAAAGRTALCYMVQDAPRGLCDALFSALPLIAAEDDVLVGLPDTVWFPEDGFRQLPGGGLSFLLFPVGRPELFDAVVTDADGRVLEIQVKRPDATSSWIWGAFKLPGWQLAELHELWCRRERA